MYSKFFIFFKSEFSKKRKNNMDKRQIDGEKQKETEKETAREKRNSESNKIDRKTDKKKRRKRIKETITKTRAWSVQLSV